MTIREKVLLEGEDRASQAFDKAGGSFSKMDGVLKKAAIAGGLSIAGFQLARIGQQSVQMAIDAEEAASAFNTTFGQALPQAAGFVEDFANKAGFATHEMEQMLAVTGNVLQGIGATEGQSADLAETMATLAGDVASFSNAAGGAPAVLQALQSAINGEREALKTYGLAIAETEVQERALANTQKTRAADLTRLEKAQATLDIAYEKAGKAVGDLDRTQDSSANTLRRLSALAKEAGVEFGQSMLPALEDLLPIIEDLIPAVGDAATALGQLLGNAATTAAGPLSHITDVVDGLSIAANSFIHVGAGVGNVIAEIFSFGHYDGALAQTAEFAAHANDIRKVSRELRAEIEKGRPAADVYADGLLGLARRSDLTAEGLDRLATAAGADTGEQLAAIKTLRDYAEANGWRAENIAVLNDRYHELQGAVDATRTAEDGLYGVVEGFSGGWADNTQAAEDNAGALGEVSEEAQKTADEIFKMAAKAEEAAAAFRDDLAAEATSFITGFEKLPKRIKISMGEFEKNLTDRIATQTEFWEGLATLAEAGMGHLAESIREQGPEAAGLLEDLVGDMERAAELDDLIAEGDRQMGELTDTYATALEDNDRILTPLGEFGKEMIDAIAAGIESGDLVGPLLSKVQSAVNRVTGRTWKPPSPGEGSDLTQYAEGTWSVPGTPGQAVGAVVHGSEIIIPPAGSSGRAQFARELATELGGVMGRGDRGRAGATVTIENINVTVPAGTTLQERVNAAAIEATVEALLS